MTVSGSHPSIGPGLGWTSFFTWLTWLTGLSGSHGWGAGLQACFWWLPACHVVPLLFRVPEWFPIELTLHTHGMCPLGLLISATHAPHRFQVLLAHVWVVKFTIPSTNSSTFRCGALSFRGWMVGRDYADSPFSRDVFGAVPCC